MTAAALTQLPLAAGGALAGAAGRVALWGLAQYARAPLSNSAIAALALFSVMAGSNALFGQEHHHPAPLFGGQGTAVANIAAPVPVIPAVRRGKPVVPSVELQTGSVPAVQKIAPVAPAATKTPIGNAEVFEVQRKLAAFGYFDGTVDGFYGPKTARAIKKFEESHGLRVKGELTRSIVETILAAPIIGDKPAAVAPLVAPEPVAAPAADPAPAVVQFVPGPDEAVVEETLPPPAAEPMAFAAPEPEPVAEAVPLPEPTPLAASLAPVVADQARSIPIRRRRR